MKRISLLFIIVTLLAGIVGCDGVGESHALAVTSTEGGSVTTPGEGMFTYEEGTVVNLLAEADEGYRFVNWTGDVGSMDNTEASTTTVTMHDDYTITANFAPRFMAAAGYYHTVGLKSDGTVVTVGNNTCGQCDVEDCCWANITQVAAGGWHTVGLKADGTLLAVGLNNYEQCNVGGWDLN